MNEKSRTWTMVVYPESLPENWKEIIEKWFIPYAISPKHDRDINESTGELKKPHYHIIICFKGPSTYENAVKYAKELGVQYIERVGQVKACYEYLYHKNNPEKAQYKEEDIKCGNGFDASIRDNQDEIELIKRRLIEMIRANQFKEYRSIVDYVLDHELYDEFRVLSKNTIFFNAYIKSLKFSIENN